MMDHIFSFLAPFFQSVTQYHLALFMKYHQNLISPQPLPGALASLALFLFWLSYCLLLASTYVLLLLYEHHLLNLQELLSHFEILNIFIDNCPRSFVPLYIVHHLRHDCSSYHMSLTMA